LARNAPRADPPPEEPARHDQAPTKALEPRSVVTVARGSDELARQLDRRREASLRLSPLECGCWDPEDPRHTAGRCRYRQRGAA
jgi:hypothetical protein